MKKVLQYLFLILVSIVLFLFIPAVFDWLSHGVFELTTKNIQEALFLGTFTPIAILFSRKIKNDFVFTFLIIIIILAVLFCIKLFLN